VNQAEFFGGKDVGAEVEVVEFVVDEFEGKHERNQSQFSTGHNKAQTDINAGH
jgi:hypothetical protein